MKAYVSIITILAVFCAAMIFPALCRADELNARLQLDGNIAEVGDSITLGIIFEGTQGVSAPTLPEKDGFRIEYLGPSTVMSIVNGRMSSSVTHRYRLIALKTGDYTFGPYTFTYGKDTYKTDQLKLKVVERGDISGQQNPQVQTSSASSLSGGVESLEDLVFIKLSTPAKKAYVNQLIPVSVKLFVRGVSVRDVQYPEFSGSGFVQDKFDKPAQYRQQLNGEVYDVVEFHTKVYAAKEGRINLGPAKLKCNMVVKRKSRPSSSWDDFFDNDESIFGDFFSRVKVVPIELKSKDLDLNIAAFPAESKPQGFNAAVGDFSMAVTCDPKKVQAGDPITMDIAISGTGNFDSIQDPELANTQGFKVYDPQVKQEDGKKTFEQVIIPQKESITRTPEVRFSYFDPDKEKYVTLSHPPIDIEVSAPAERSAQLIDESTAEKPKTPGTEVVGKDILYIKDDLGDIKIKGRDLYEQGGFIALQILPVLLFLPVYFIRKRKDHLRADVRYARKLKAPKVARSGLKSARACLEKGDSSGFYDQVFKTMQEYLGHRFNCRTASITAEILEDLSRNHEFDKAAVDKLKHCFNECDIARYTNIGADRRKMEEVLADLEQAIDYFERKKR